MRTLIVIMLAASQCACAPFVYGFIDGWNGTNYAGYNPKAGPGPSYGSMPTLLPPMGPSSYTIMPPCCSSFPTTVYVNY